MSRSPNIATDDGRRQLAQSVDYMMAQYAGFSTEPEQLVFQAQSAMAIFTPYEIVQMFVTAMHHANGHKIYESKPAEPRPHSINESGQRALNDPSSEFMLDMMVVGYGESRINTPDQYARMISGRKAFEGDMFTREQLHDMLMIAIERMTDGIED